MARPLPAFKHGEPRGIRLLPIIKIPQNINIELDSLHILKDTIRDMGGSIEDESEDYFSSTFSSGIFGFVDDFEIRIHPVKKLIHIRSASRVGHSDMGVL